MFLANRSRMLRRCTGKKNGESQYPNYQNGKQFTCQHRDPSVDHCTHKTAIGKTRLCSSNLSLVMEMNCNRCTL